MGTALSSMALERLVQAVLTLQESVAFRDFPAHALRVAHALVAADMCSYGEVGLSGCHAATESDAGNPLTPTLIDAWARNTLGPEVLPTWRVLPMLEPVAIADHVDRDQLRATGLWQEYLREIEAHHQLILPFAREPIGDGEVVRSLGLNRSTRGFSAVDRELLRRLGPHVERAHASAQLLELAQLGSSLVALDDGWARVSSAAITLGPELRVRACTATARAWLQTYFDERAPLAAGLPEPVERWARRCLAHPSTRELVARMPLTIEREGGRLEAHLIGTRAEGRLLLVLRHHVSLSPAELSARLGLTSREVEVTRWLVRGKTNAEIGQILSISARTVQAHLHNIFPKLGADSRLEAASRVRERLALAALVETTTTTKA